MALLNDLIKKYEEEARQRIAKAQEINQPKKAKREDIFLKVETAPLKELHERDTSPRGSIWKAKPLKTNVHSKVPQKFGPEQTYKSREELEEENERLKAENEELRRKLSELQLEKA